MYIYIYSIHLETIGESPKKRSEVGRCSPSGCSKMCSLAEGGSLSEALSRHLAWCTGMEAILPSNDIVPRLVRWVLVLNAPVEIRILL